MRTTRQVSLLTICIGILLLIGACSAGGGTPATPDPNPDLTNYASSVEGIIYQNGGPASSGHVFIYDLTAFELYNKADIGSNGEYIAGIDGGQFLIFGFSPTGWQPPMLEGNFSNYINVESDYEYRLDIELTSEIPEGEELVFGFVTSSENDLPVIGATVSAGGRSTTTDGYGFYAMVIPGGTGNFKITANGFYDLNENIREGQSADGYYATPFFNLNPIGQTGSSIGGTVRDVYDGRALGGARVTLESHAEPTFGSIRYLTNLGGKYRFFNLSEGIYRLTFERPGYLFETREELVIVEQDEIIVNMFMHQDISDLATVSGYVNSAGAPLPINGARVTASNPLLGSYMTFTNPTGHYTLANMIPENYTITVITPPIGGSTYYEAASTFQTVVPGDNHIDFALRYITEGVLRGNVSIDGVAPGDYAFPPTGIEITAEKVGGFMSGVQWRSNTDGLGVFVFNGIPMGFYKVTGVAEYSSIEVYSGTVFNVVVNEGTTTIIDLSLILN